MAWRRIDEVCETLLNRLNIDAEACVSALAMADALRKETGSAKPPASQGGGNNASERRWGDMPLDTQNPHGTNAVGPLTMSRGKFTRTGVYLALVMSR